KKTSEVNIAAAYIGLEDYREAIAAYGEETGAMLLDELLEVIEKAIDGQAELARTNSDEFVIGRSGDEAGILVRHIARKILEAVSEPLAVQSWRIKLGVSIGLAEARVTRT